MGAIAVMRAAEARLVRVCWRMVIGSGHVRVRAEVREGMIVY